MKKFFKVLFSVGVLSALLCTSAFAATGGYTTDKDGIVNYNDGTYTAQYTGVQDGKQYVLLVVKGTDGNYSVSEDTIMYIDQQEASNGSVSFDFIPKSTPGCVVLLGGEFTNGTSPKTLGTLTSQGVTVSGKVLYQGTYSTATVQLKDKTSGDVLYETQTDTSGNYSFNSVAVGEYNLYVTKKSYLTYTRAVSIEDTVTMSDVDITKLAGDVNTSGKVNTADLSKLISNFNGNEEFSDINQNGKVNSTDLSALLSSFNATNYIE